MKKAQLYLYWSIALVGILLGSCENDYSGIDNNVTFPKEKPIPEGLRFDYLIYENDFNAVPKDGHARNYSGEFPYSESSGLAFVVSDAHKYGPAMNAVIKTVKKDEWYKISFACYNEIGVGAGQGKGLLAAVCYRNDSVYNYQQFKVEDLLKEVNKQIVGKWEDLTVWYELPAELQAGDQIRIYHWNPNGGKFFIDNFTVEAWTKTPLQPEGVALSHGIYEQNYETADLGVQRTKETAYRGVHAGILGRIKGRQEYGIGYQGTLAEANIAAGDFVRVRFAGLKKHKVRRHLIAANMVVSLARGEQQLFWEGFPIDSRLQKDGKQAYGEWSSLECWQQIPVDAQGTDVLKIYPWNPQGHPIYLDDIVVEVWKKPSN